MMWSVVITLLGACIGAVHPHTPSCPSVLKTAQLVQTGQVVPPSLHGTWVSSRCERRPGFQNVLRSYKFYPHSTTTRSSPKSGSFVLQLHLFTDTQCSAAFATYTAKGEYYVIAHQSLTVPGGTDVDYTLSRVTVVPHTREAAEILSTKVSKACPLYRNKNWQAGKSYKVLWNSKSTTGLNSKSGGRQYHHTAPTTEHSLVYFHDDVSNTTHTVNLQTTKPKTYRKPHVPNYIEQNEDYLSDYFQLTGGFYGKTAPAVAKPTDEPTDVTLQKSVFEASIPEQLPRKRVSVSGRESGGYGNVKKDSSSASQGVYFDCSLHTGVNWHELQLMKVQQREAHFDEDLESNDLGRMTVRELFLGAVGLEQLRPTAYQHPLVFLEKSSSNNVSRIIATSDEYNPPILGSGTVPPNTVPLAGAWASGQCEVMPHGLFLTRFIQFSTKTSWQIIQEHYVDPSCRIRSYTTRAGGTYALAPTAPIKRPVGTKSTSLRNPFLSKKSVNDVRYYSFFKTLMKTQTPPELVQDSVAHLLMEYLYITPSNLKVANQLNEEDSKCGVPGSWRKGVEQKLSRGCQALGIHIPTIYRQKIYIERDGTKVSLYLGTIIPDNKLTPNLSTSHTIPQYHRQLSLSNLGDKTTNATRYPYNDFWVPTLIRSWSPPLTNCRVEGGYALYFPTMARRSSNGVIFVQSSFTTLIIFFLLLCIFTN